MNCLNCAAPLELVANGSHFFCPYCESRHFPTALEDSDDGIVATGKPGQHECPCCDDFQALHIGLLEKVRVEYCPRCRGTLMPSESFPIILGRRRRRNAYRDPAPTPLDPTELQRRLPCPECRRNMDVHPFHGPGNAVIDSCHRCRLIWLDHGEFAVLETAPGRLS